MPGDDQFLILCPSCVFGVGTAIRGTPAPARIPLGLYPPAMRYLLLDTLYKCFNPCLELLNVLHAVIGLNPERGDSLIFKFLLNRQ